MVEQIILVISSKLYTILPPQIVIWKSENFILGIAQCLLRATELPPNCSTKITILIAILLGAYCSYETVGPINYAWLNSPTLIFSLDIIEAQFR